MKNFKIILFLFFIFYLPCLLFSQEYELHKHLENNEQDKCGYDEILSKSLLKILGDHWGYGYDSLLVDLKRWKQSPYVTIDSLGASVKNRAIWELTITSNTVQSTPRKTVYIHARTHPNEVQSFWVTNEMINILLSESEFAKSIRESCAFYIIPMYNPDGVELEYGRENANRVDIESNWYSNDIQPEVVVLRTRFTELMWSNAPIEVALNMHSSIRGERYFVYHDAAGTSIAFTELEKQFIGNVRSYFFDGIAPWYYFVSWTNGTPYKYPESWFWLNHREDVMALTYEDINGPSASDFDKTANALLRGVADYLGLDLSTGIIADQTIPLNFDLEQNYPNPFPSGSSSAFSQSASTNINYFLPSNSIISIKIFDLQGKEISTVYNGLKKAGKHHFIWHADNLANGIYFYQLIAKNPHNLNIQYSMVKKATLFG